MSPLRDALSLGGEVRESSPTHPPGECGCPPGSHGLRQPLLREPTKTARPWPSTHGLERPIGEGASREEGDVFATLKPAQLQGLQLCSHSPSLASLQLSALGCRARKPSMEGGRGRSAAPKEKGRRGYVFSNHNRPATRIRPHSGLRLGRAMSQHQKGDPRLIMRPGTFSPTPLPSPRAALLCPLPLCSPGRRGGGLSPCR